MELDNITILIMFIVFIGLMGSFISQYGEWWETQGPLEKCSQSVKQSSALRLAGHLRAFEESINCPPRDIEINEPLNQDYGQQKAKQEIADSMYKCFDKFWKGDVVLFEEEGVFCAVCDWIEFTDKGKKFGRLNEYLAETLVPGETISYMDFLAKKETPHFKEVFDDPEYYDRTFSGLDEEIDSNKLYSTVLVYMRGQKGITQFQENYLMGGGTIVGGAVVGSTGRAVSVGMAHRLRLKALQMIGGDMAVARFGGTLAEGLVAGEALAKEAAVAEAATARYGVGALIRTVMTNPVVLVTATVAGTSAAAVLSVFKVATPEWVAMPVFVEHNEEAFDSIGCHAFTTTKELKG
ncbi:MAG: hypothetical protein ACE5FT_02345 [Candidatus Nanoarchaeia archaeon]